MLYAGLDLSRKRLDFHLLDGEGATVEVGAAPPDADGLLGLTRRLDRHREPIRAAIESMNGARFVHDRLELQGWQVEIADAQKVKGLAPLACKTDRIDAWVLASPIAAAIGDIGRSPARASSPATRASAHASTNQANATYAARSPNKGRSICAGRSSRPPPTPAPHPSTATATSTRKPGSANNAAPRSPKSTSPADSPKRSGTCSPVNNPSLP